MNVQDNYCQELIKGLNEDQIDVRSDALEGKLRGWYWFLSVTRPPHRRWLWLRHFTTPSKNGKRVASGKKNERIA